MWQKMFAEMLVVSLMILSVGQSMAEGTEGDDGLKDLGMRCREENNLKQEETELLRPAKYVDTTDQRIKCFIKCMLTGLGMMSEKGDFTAEGIPENMKKYKSHFPACESVTGIDVCDKALNFRNCIWKKSSQQEQSSN